MNPKVVISSVAVLIIVVAIIAFRNPETVQDINVPGTGTTQKTGNESILEEIFGGGGFGGGFGGGGVGGSGGGGGGGGGAGGGGGGGGGATTIIIGGSTTSTIPGGTSTTSTISGTSTSTTSSSTSTSTTTSIIGGTSTTSTISGTSTSTTSSSTSTSIPGCPSNFAIDYALDCKGTTGSQDDVLSVKVTNNEQTGYTFDVFVDGTNEGLTSAAGYGSFGLRYSSIMTNWWRAQGSSSSRSFSVRIEYLGSCSMTRSVSITFPPSISQCVD